MKKSSQKPTNGNPVGKPATNERFLTANQEGVTKPENGRFTGMSDNIEKLAPEIIQGYKVRG